MSRGCGKGKLDTYDCAKLWSSAVRLSTLVHLSVWPHQEELLREVVPNQGIPETGSVLVRSLTYHHDLTIA